MDIPSLPFAFEYGAELQYSWRNDDGYKMNFLGVKAPANILYNFEFPSAPVSFVPLVGIDLGVYVLGKEDDEDIFTEFMGEKLSRFILDWHIGAKICYDKFFFSATYESPITCMYNKDGVKIFNKFTNLSLGIRF